MSAATIGALRKRLTIEQAVRSGDGGGGASVSWTVLATVWGRVRPLDGREALEADRTAARLRLEITIRHRSDVRPDMRFHLGTRIFHILAVRNEEERGRWLVCRCEERCL